MDDPSPVEMLRMVGFALAHAVWSIHEGETLVPMALVETKQGRALNRFSSEEQDLEQVVVTARGTIESLGDEFRISVLVYDGYVTHEGDRTDALIAEARRVGQPFALVITLRYDHATEERPFRILGDPLWGADLPDEYRTMCLDLLMQGVDEHEHGSEIWRARWEH